MIITCEKFQDSVYILDSQGNIWKFQVDYSGEAKVQRLVAQLSRNQIEGILMPKLATFDKDLL